MFDGVVPRYTSKFVANGAGFHDRVGVVLTAVAPDTGSTCTG